MMNQNTYEATLTIALYLFFFFWWTIFAYGLGCGDPDDYAYICGMPTWFFFSCIVGWVMITLLVGFVVSCCFRDIPLD